jgi:hypothetical protein
MLGAVPHLMVFVHIDLAMVRRSLLSRLSLVSLLHDLNESLVVENAKQSLIVLLQSRGPGVT